MSELRYWVWFASHSRPKTAAKLLKRFGTPEDIYFAAPEDFSGTLISAKELEYLKEKNLDGTDYIIDRCGRLGIQILTIGDASYPDMLRHIYDPPTVLYTKGNIALLDGELTIGIVGTRRCSLYGYTSAYRTAFEIGSAGGTVISGLASGIDTAAALGALDSGARVIGVLGNGIDVVFPKGAESVYRAVCDRGVLVTEYPPKTPPKGSNFPQRNRIISGLSYGTLVVEAPEKSGALITAAYALEQGRDVFAIPGNIDKKTCAGTNRLIREGAMVVSGGEDVLCEYRGMFGDKIGKTVSPSELDIGRRLKTSSAGIMKNPTNTDRVQKQNVTESPKKTENPGDSKIPEVKNEPETGFIRELDETEQGIVDLLRKRSCQIDELTNELNIPSQTVLATLTMLEIDGIVKQLPGKYFSVNL